MISGELGMICAELIYAIHLILTFVEEFNCAIVQIAQQLISEIKWIISKISSGSMSSNCTLWKPTPEIIWPSTEEQNRSVILIYLTVLPKLGKTSAEVLKKLGRADMKRPSSFYQSGDKTVIRNTLNMLIVKGRISFSQTWSDICRGH